MKKLILVILLFFISLSCVSANNYSKSDGLNWLNSHVSWASASIEDVSFALLALNSNNYDITTGLGFLKSRKDTTGCYPTGACTTKDTALAALALSELGEDITNQLNWINQTLKQADVTGAWIIQIIPGISTGICTFTHKQNSQEIEITEPSSQWIYIQNDLSISITDPIETINVNCDLPSTTKISLIRKVGTSEFHIVQEETSNNVDMIINNACYPQTLTSTSCNIESSFYVSWALNKLNQEINTLPYLEDNVNNNLYYTMIQSIDSNQNYITYLISNQNSAGYWTDIYTTSFVINSLKTDYSSQNAVENATSWLEAQQVTTPGENQGSWNNGNVLDTAVALYLGLTTYTGGNGYSGAGEGYCGDGYIQEPNYYNLNEECDDGNFNSGDGCSSNCEIEDSGTECSTNIDCTNVGEECNLITNTCQLIPGFCLTTNTCGPNEYCDLITNTCISFQSCINNLDCSDNQYCDLTTNTCKQSQTSQCGNNLCEVGEDYISCPLDCPTTSYDTEFYCSDRLDDDDDGYIDCEDTDCYQDPDCKKGSLWWIWLIIIIIIIAGVVFAYFYFSKSKKPKAGPSYLGPQRPSSTPPRQPTVPQPGPSYRRSPRDQELESELDKSIKEAQKLLQKK